MAAGVADQIKALAFVLAVTETVWPTAACVVDAVSVIASAFEFDLLQANKNADKTNELKRAFFIIDFFKRMFLICCNKNTDAELLINRWVIKNIFF